MHASYGGEQEARSKRWGSMDSPSIPKVDMEQLGDNTDYEEAHLPIHEFIDAIPGGVYDHEVEEGFFLH